MPENRSLRLALGTSLASAVAVPLVGLASAPILTQTVGAAGRGEVAAAIAPNVLILAVAAMGLPESLTYHLAKGLQGLRRAFLVATGICLALGAALATVAVILIPVLSGGDDDLGQTTLIATVIAVPALVCGTLRALASAWQFWYRVAIERTIGAFARLIALVVLLVAGRLTVESAVLVICLAPFVSNLVYVPVLVRSFTATDRSSEPPHPLVRPLIAYALRTWVGSIAGILLARLGVLLFTPLSNPTQLGLYVVGITIADIPILLALAIKDALFGVNSRSRDAAQFASVARISFLLGLLGSSAIAVSLPLWIGFVFGKDFQAAVPTAWILLGCAVANVPTFILAAGTGAWGRPGLRSIGLLLTLVLDVVAFVALVPTHGAVGAATANLISALFGSGFSLMGTSRVLGLPVSALLVPTAADLHAGLAQVRRLAGQLRKGPRSVDAPSE